MTALLVSAIISVPAFTAQSALAQADEAVAGSGAQTEIQTFSSAFDTFVNTDPQGYGVYEERDSSTFSPGEDIILYIEPVGFEYGTTEEGALFI